MKSVHKRGSAGAYHPRAPGKPGPQLLAALSEVQLDLEFAFDVAVLPRDVQVEGAQSLVAVPADVGVPSPSHKRGPMVPSARDLSPYPPGV